MTHMATCISMLEKDLADGLKLLKIWSEELRAQIENELKGKNVFFSRRIIQESG